MAILLHNPPENGSSGPWKGETNTELSSPRNPVLDSAHFIAEGTDLVKINEPGLKNAARFIRSKILSSAYTPCTWRTHALHICPIDQGTDTEENVEARRELVLNWIFLISSLNFSFWSEKKEDERYGVDWYERWEAPRGETKRWTGYWSLVAAIDRALDEGIPFTDPWFYSCEKRCPDDLIRRIFRPSAQSEESIPLLEERIRILRDNGKILCQRFNGSFSGLIREFNRLHNGEGTSLDLVRMVTDTFPTFRDESHFHGHKVRIWKRAQILVAEIWAAFHPPVSLDNTLVSSPHPIFPGRQGPSIHLLTMFADYRVPQILHHLNILHYSTELVKLLYQGTPLAYGCTEEVSLRGVSILAVEKVRKEILRLDEDDGKRLAATEVSSVLIDFYLWDLAKRVESGEEVIDDVENTTPIPVHRTRSIWY